MITNNLTTVKHRTPDQIKTSYLVTFPNLKWFGNKLVRKILVAFQQSV